jgi:chemotaxis signal transduction protein
VAAHDAPGAQFLPAAAADHLVVRAGGTEYALPMSSVLEVSPACLPTIVPGLPDYIRGVVSFNDHPTPVVDPARFIGGPLLELSEHSCLVFLGGVAGGWVAALLIDEIVGVFNAAAEQEPQEGKSSPLLAPAFVVCEGRRVTMMRLQALFTEQGGAEAGKGRRA